MQVTAEQFNNVVRRLGVEPHYWFTGSKGYEIIEGIYNGQFGEARYIKVKSGTKKNQKTTIEYYVFDNGVWAINNPGLEVWQ